MKTISTKVMEPRQDSYPRPLRAKERDLLEFVLPLDSPGYAEYRSLIDRMVVLAEGRRGRGNVVLGKLSDRADIDSPLPPVIAYGMIETTFDTFSITVRECVADQLDIEIVSSRGDEIPDHFEEKRRWTYSTWKPGFFSPATEKPVREVKVSSTITLVIAVADKRIWLHDAVTGMNHLIPITNFHNELMLLKRIRDPKIALRTQRFFEEADNYSDEDLRQAFVAYNRIKRKVDVVVEETPIQKKGLRATLRRMFKR